MFAASKTDSASTGDYQISRSLRFNSADSAYLNRTPASAGNRKTWTWSAWVKRGSLGSAQTLFSASDSTGSNEALISFPATDVFRFYSYIGSLQMQLDTTQVFRDPSAWYHFVVSVDTTQATASNRAKLYVNGSQITALDTATYSAQNYDTYINTTQPHSIGRDPFTGRYLNGYMTEVNFIDGQALTPSSFGETDTQTGVWKPKAYSGSYGTNGFYLNFSDNSNTTAATLGKDYSGNGNNFTPNNFSVTAGAGNDSLVDSPTSYGVDTGVGGTVRGNYCTLNPLDKSTSGGATSNGNLDYAATQSSWDMIRSTFGMSTGKWYWEVSVNSSSYGITGIAQSSVILQNNYFDTGNCYGYNSSNGQKYGVGGTGIAYGASWNASGDICGVAFDADAGTLTFYKNGTSQGLAYNVVSGTYFPAHTLYSSGSTATINFGQRPFAYTAPSGFKALCTQNLPTPTIGATTATQAGKYFNAVTYTGTGSSLGVTGVGFQPDWVWVKSRSAATDHGLYDAVRGVQKQLESNGTGAETTETTGLTAFGSDGFTTGALAQLNTSSATYVAWNWKANGSGSSNTAGSITSTVSANTTSGFSIVTYTGQSGAGTVGHGLGVAPSMIIVKSRSNGAYGWAVWHSAFTQSEYLILEATDAKGTASNYWNSSAPSTWTSAFGVGSGPKYNNNTGDTFVAYCFAQIAGYSAFGSYTGNGSANGPFIFTGFKPAFVLIKSSTVASSSWRLWDAKRSTYNVVNSSLFPNLSNAEVSTADYAIDFLSNGIKIRAADDGQNYSGGTFIYAAFAEAPQKFSLAR